MAKNPSYTFQADDVRRLLERSIAAAERRAVGSQLWDEKIWKRGAKLDPARVEVTAAMIDGRRVPVGVILLQLEFAGQGKGALYSVSLESNAVGGEDTLVYPVGGITHKPAALAEARTSQRGMFLPPRLFEKALTQGATGFEIGIGASIVARPLGLENSEAAAREMVERAAAKAARGGGGCRFKIGPVQYLIKRTGIGTFGVVVYNQAYRSVGFGGAFSYLVNGSLNDCQDFIASTLAPARPDRRKAA